jgi:hypothetical protein
MNCFESAYFSGFAAPVDGLQLRINHAGIAVFLGLMFKKAREK